METKESREGYEAPSHMKLGYLIRHIEEAGTDISCVFIEGRYNITFFDDGVDLSIDSLNADAILFIMEALYPEEALLVPACIKAGDFVTGRDNSKHIITFNGKEVWCYGDPRCHGIMTVECEPEMPATLIDTEPKRFRLSRIEKINIEQAWTMELERFLGLNIDNVSEVTIEYNE